MNRSYSPLLCAVLGLALLPSALVGQVNTARTMVRIDATGPIAEESSRPFRRMNLIGEFTISRVGPTNNALPVFLTYSGSATFGVDYPTLPFLVSIPAGATSAVVRVEAKPDDLAEPLETLVATISNCPPDREPRLLLPCYDFEVLPSKAAATIYLRDDGLTEASVTITNPHSGDVFKLGSTITIDAVAIDLNGYISHVDFYDGDRKIGESQIFFIVAPPDGSPIYHSFEWREALPGAHALTARAQVPTPFDDPVISPSKTIISPTVTIRVEGDDPSPTIVRIDATRPVAEEDSFPLDRLPLVGEFTISRSGPTNTAVRTFLHISGTATPDVDYKALPFAVTIPAGAASVAFRVEAVADSIIEGVETVVAQLANCPPPMDPPILMPCFFVPFDPAHTVATVYIRDTAFDSNRAPAVHIVKPIAGETFPLNTPITIAAEARDPDGYVPKAEFFADGRKIGEERLEFLVAPPPGEIQRFEFTWRAPEPGAHRLTVRVTDHQGATGNSSPVEIVVAPDQSLPIVTVVARDCFASEPVDPANTLNTATFLVRRYGPTNAALTVYYALAGTASNGVDYDRLATSVTIPAGRRSATVVIRPLADNLIERYETVTLRLQSPANTVAGYLVGRPAGALAVISDHPWVRFAADGACQRLDQHCAFVAFAADAGFQFRVEASPDLRHWETLCVQPAVEPAVLFADEEAENLRARFYRITPEPVPLED